jgi:hypothetical protein
MSVNWVDISDYDKAVKRGDAYKRRALILLKGLQEERFTKLGLLEVINHYFNEDSAYGVFKNEDYPPTDSIVDADY